MIADGRFALVKTTLLDYPGKVAAAVFLPGCHLRCPYCHNRELVDPEAIREACSPQNPSKSLNCSYEALDAFLAKRARILGGLAVSGGEALLHPLLPAVLDLASKYKLPVKLDTAGLLPDKLQAVIERENSPVRFVAMDLKTEPRRYEELGWPPTRADAEILLKRSLKILRDSELEMELRTTVVPPLVDKRTLEALLPLAAGSRWILQTYRPGDTLNPDWAEMRAPDERELTEWASELNRHRPPDSGIGVR